MRSLPARVPSPVRGRSRTVVAASLAALSLALPSCGGGGAERAPSAPFVAGNPDLPVGPAPTPVPVPPTTFPRSPVWTESAYGLGRTLTVQTLLLAAFALAPKYADLGCVGGEPDAEQQTHNEREHPSGPRRVFGGDATRGTGGDDRLNVAIAVDIQLRSLQNQPFERVLRNAVGGEGIGCDPPRIQVEPVELIGGDKN